MIRFCRFNWTHPISVAEWRGWMVYWIKVLAQHDYPPVVEALVAEMALLTASDW